MLSPAGMSKDRSSIESVTDDSWPCFSADRQAQMSIQRSRQPALTTFLLSQCSWLTISKKWTMLSDTPLGSIDLFATLAKPTRVLRDLASLLLPDALTPSFISTDFCPLTLLMLLVRAAEYDFGFTQAFPMAVCWEVVGRVVD